MSAKAKAQAKPCKLCNEEIPAERVEALPGTLVCVKCSKDVGGETKSSHTVTNVGKGIKVLNAGIHVEFTRKTEDELWRAKEKKRAKKS